MSSRSRKSSEANRRRFSRAAGQLEELETRDVPALLGQQLFPSDYPWNQNIADAPAAANSAAVISHIGASINIHPDWGNDSPSNGDDPLYGIPFNVVHGNSTPKVNVVIDAYPGESDIVPVPIPANAVIEGDYQNGPNLNGAGYNSGQRGDSHLIIWDEDDNIAYELYLAARPNDKNNKTGGWEAAQETVWNMNTDQFRTLGYTSADAAGLSILAGLVRPDEGLPVSQGGQGAIDHALRFTLPSGDINPQYIYPASHQIDVGSQASDKLPMGARLRLESTPQVDQLISKMSPEAQIIATAMQQYGLVLADDGSAMYVTGASGSVDAGNNLDLTWNMDDVLGLESLTATDFQVVNLTPIVAGLSNSTGESGTTVTITGQNFSGAAGNLSVLFGATPSPSVTYVSDTEITALVPAGSGTVDVTVQSGVNEEDTNSDNPNANVNAPIFGYGTSATSPADLFTFITQTVSGANSSVGFASPTVAAGDADVATFVIVDANGNPVAGLPSSAFKLSLGGGASNGAFSAVAPTSTPGTYTATFTGGAAGSPSNLTVTVAGVQLVEPASVQVQVGAVDGGNTTVNFDAPTDASGTADAVEISVEDAGGNMISGLPSNVFALSLAGGTSTGSFGPVTAGPAPGTYTTSFTGAIAGNASMLTLTVNSVPIASQPTVTVTPGGVGGGTSSASFASGSAASGQTDMATIIVKDAAGNPISGLTNSAFSFALSAGGSTGTFGPVSATATPGAYTTAFTGVLAGAPSTLTVSVGGVPITATPSIQVTAGGVGGGSSSVSFASPSVASGTRDIVTILVKDDAGNAIAGLPASAFALSLGGGSSTGTFADLTETTPGTYTAPFTGVIAGSARALTVTVSGVELSSHPQVTVTPGAPSAIKSTVTLASPMVAAGKSDRATIIVKDAAGNAVTGLGSGAFEFTFSSGESNGAFSAVSETSTKGTYAVEFTGATAGTASSLTTSVNGVVLASSPKVTVKAGTLSGVASTMSFASPSVASGAADTVTVRLTDAGGNPFSGVTSSEFVFHLAGGLSTGTFSAATASAPGVYTVTFKGVRAGSGSMVSLTVAGVAIDSHPVIQVTPGVPSAAKSKVSAASDIIHSGSSELITIAVKDAAGNPVGGLTAADFSLGFAGGKSTGTFASLSETSTAGTYTVALTGVIAGTVSYVRVEVDGVLASSKPMVGVRPGAVSGTNSTVAFTSPTVATGKTDTLTITVTDEDGNGIYGLTTPEFKFVMAGGSSTGKFAAVTATATAGVYHVVFTAEGSGTPSDLTVEVNGVSLADDPTIQVT